MNAAILLFLTVARADLVKYYLYTPDNPDEPVLITPEDAHKHVIKRLGIKIFFHGYLSDYRDATYSTLKKGFLTHGNYNIIGTDYGNISRIPIETLVKRTPDIAEEVARFILTLTQKGYPLKGFEVVGHSLGGHLVGFVGKSFFKMTNKKIYRISALDPTGPFFQSFQDILGIHTDPSDAEVVFVIHTDRTALGYLTNCGNVDIHPNGGVGPQPGCLSPKGDLIYQLACSHWRSWQFYVDALSYPGNMIAVECGSYGEFLVGKCKNGRRIDIGGEITPKDHGTYYLKTTSFRPFRSLDDF